MNGKRAKSIRRKTNVLYNSLSKDKKKKISKRRMYQWLKKIYKKGDNNGIKGNKTTLRRRKN